MPRRKSTSAYSKSEGTPEDELLAKNSKHVNSDIGVTYADLFIINQADPSLLWNSKYLDEGTTTLGDPDACLDSDICARSIQKQVNRPRSMLSDAELLLHCLGIAH